MKLSETPFIHETARVTDSVLGRYTEVGANCHVSHSTLGDYSYCVENTQIAYAEIWVTPVLWPDFTRIHLYEAIAEYQRRERRFGKVSV